MDIWDKLEEVEGTANGRVLIGEGMYTHDKALDALINEALHQGDEDAIEYALGAYRNIFNGKLATRKIELQRSIVSKAQNIMAMGALYLDISESIIGDVISDRDVMDEIIAHGKIWETSGIIVASGKSYPRRDATKKLPWAIVKLRFENGTILKLYTRPKTIKERGRVNIQLSLTSRSRKTTGRKIYKFKVNIKD